MVSSGAKSAIWPPDSASRISSTRAGSGAGSEIFRRSGMCGIVAVYSPRGSVNPADLERATQRLYSRGPDGKRQWIAPHGRAGLGHARLSIIDLTTGDQPIASEDGQRHIVVNGEFYDFERIQRELKQK